LPGRAATLDLGVAPHHLDARTLDLLAIDLAGAGEEAVEGEVRGAIEQDRPGRLAIAPRTPDLLIVRIGRIAGVVVEDETDVRLVDAQAEGYRRDDDGEAIAHEIILDGPSNCKAAIW